MLGKGVTADATLDLDSVPTEHAGYLIVEATAQQLAGVGVTLLLQEKFSVRLWM